MIEHDLEKLLFNGQSLLNYYERYRDYVINDHDNNPLIYREKDPLTRRVVTIGDFISALVDIQCALSVFVNDVDETTRKSLQVILAKIEAIVVNNVTQKNMMVVLDEILATYEENIKGIGNDDLTYFGFANSNREMIEKRLYILNRYLSVKKGDSILFEFMKKLNKLDRMLMESIALLKRNLPEIEKPFPARPFYKPDSYWWYLE